MVKRKSRGFKDKLDTDRQRRSPLFAGMSGRRDADVSGTVGATPNLRGMLLAAFGPGKRSAIDTRAAAKGLGVSQRTVERWIADPSRQQRIASPKAATLKKLSTQSKQAATTQAGRRRVMQGVRQSPEGKRLSRYGGRITVRGKQGVKGSGGYYIVNRTITIPPSQDALTPAEIESMWSAYEQGGDKGLSTWLTDTADDKYVTGWEFETINDFRIDPT